MNYNFRILNTNELQANPIRDLRAGTIERIKERIVKRGYNQAKPLTVCKKGEAYLVADGNHRLEVIKELGINEVPCIVYNGESDFYKLATEANVDEDTYAPMDLFDWLSVIKNLKTQGFTQQEIGDKIGWSRENVRNYVKILETFGTPILDLCKDVQIGRVPQNGTTVPKYDFNEGWFRSSGLYDLNDKYQLRLINSFISDKCNWNKAKVQSEAAKYKLWQQMIESANMELVDGQHLNIIIELVEKGTFKTIEQAKKKIAELNKGAKNKLICGDALNVLNDIEDGTINLVITDPPYGIEYESNYSKYNEYVSKESIANDGQQEALELLEKTCLLLDSKTQEDAHLYFFTSWKMYSKFEQIISGYFKVQNMIVWDKGNTGMGDLNNAWGNKHELIIFASKGRKSLSTRRADIISVPRVSTVGAVHSTQKPVELINEILKVSAVTKDIVCDPFMGSGSTIKAVQEYNKMNNTEINYIGIELDAERFERAKSYIGGE